MTNFIDNISSDLSEFKEIVDKKLNDSSKYLKVGDTKDQAVNTKDNADGEESLVKKKSSQVIFSFFWFIIT